MESSGHMPASSPGGGVPPGAGHAYPLTFSVDYPARILNRLTTALRIFTIIPIAILAAALEGGEFRRPMREAAAPATPAAASGSWSSPCC